MSERTGYVTLLGENVAEAMHTVRGQRTRSLLLMLGVAIGTATLLAMISLLFGLKGKLREDIVAANRPYLNIMKFDPFSAQNAEEAKNRKNFTPELYEEFKERVETMDTVIFTRELAPQAVPPMLFFGKERSEFIWVWGSSLGVSEIFNLEIAEGRFLTEDEIARRRRVIVLGYGPWQELFPHRDPIGQVVRVGNERYRVVGVFAERKHISGRLGENYACIPYTTFGRDFGTEDDQISFQATLKEGVTLEEATEEATAVLRVLRGLRPGEENDFHILASETMQELLDSLTMGVMLVLVVLSSIGLLVGGIGVMNMLLISVSERTREVGVRMALGARRRDVLLQFLTEATVLTGLGGVAGAILGYGLAVALTGRLRFPFYWEGWMVALAVGFSMMVGLIFGIYPARRAARMQPIDALRYE
jgi:putative ABC transport system permease protein